MTDPALSIKTDRGRYYVHPGKQSQVPSITNIKDMKNIPALKYWAARECADYTADNVAKLAGLNRDEVFQLVKGAPFQRTGKKNQSSLVGDIVHNWIDRTIKGEEVDPSVYTGKDGREAEPPLQARQMWRQFSGPGGFQDRYKPKWVASEFTVWSDTYGYAGTGDWYAYIGNALVLGDHKTGNNVYPDTAMQLSALANADYILEVDGTEKPLPKFDRFAVLHIRPLHSKLIPVEHTDEWFKAFLGLKACFDCVVNYEDETLVYAPKLEVRA
jgi:hypothetical protein